MNRGRIAGMMAIVGLGILAAGCPKVTPRPAGEAHLAIEGKWQGTVTQYRPGEATYRVEMTISRTQTNPVQFRGSIKYPSLNCGGALTFLGIEENAVEFRETIEFGVNACITGGTVRLQSLSATSLKWEWFFPEGDLGGDATLARVP